MAEEWKKFKQKLESKRHVPKESDWAAMQQKIAGHPNLGRRFSMGVAGNYLISAVLVAVASAGLWFYMHEPADRTKIDRVEQQQSSAPQDETNLESAKVMEVDANPAKADGGKSLAEQFGVEHSDEKSRDKPLVEKSGNEEVALDVAGATGSKGTGSGFQPSVASPSQSFGRNPIGGTEKDTGFLSDGASGESRRLVSEGIHLVHKHHSSTNSLLLRENFVQPKKQLGIGLRLDAINLMTDMEVGTFGFGYHASGLGADVDIMQNNWLLNIGFYSMNENYGFYDSTLIHEVYQWQEPRVDSTWVIDAPFSGHYEYDTNMVSSSDTTSYYQEDIHRSRLTIPSVELPVYLGYRLHSARWSFDLSAGVVFRWQDISGHAEILDHFGDSFRVDVALRAGVGYHINSRWSILARAGWRRNSIGSARLYWQTPDPLFLQAGLAYHF